MGSLPSANAVCDALFSNPVQVPVLAEGGRGKRPGPLAFTVKGCVGSKSIQMSKIDLWGAWRDPKIDEYSIIY